jgi:hypothetical protein
VLPQISCIVDEQAPFPELLEPPEIVHPPSETSEKSETSASPPPGALIWHPQSVPACSRQVPICPWVEAPDVNVGPKHENGVPPLSTHPSAFAIELLQLQSCEHASSAVMHPALTHDQQVWNDGTTCVANRLWVGEHGPGEPPLDPVPLDPTPLDPIPLDPTPLDPEAPDDDPPPDA